MARGGSGWLGTVGMARNGSGWYVVTCNGCDGCSTRDDGHRGSHSRRCGEYPPVSYTHLRAHETLMNL
eukprot:5159741-Prymnesium_polylepis.1